jgi:alkylation response protein AidB-like acyl-CoA dehydrogenase
MPQMIFDDEDGTIGLLRDSVQGFAASFPGPQRLRQRRAAGTDLDHAVWAGMAEAGWLGLTLPESLGGAGLGASEQAVLAEALGRALITEPLAFLAVFPNALIAAADDGAERSRLAGGIVDGSLIVAPAFQGAHGNPAPVIANGLSLNGSLHFVNGAASATDFLVLAQDADGVMIVSVPAGEATVTLRPTLDGAQLGTITFAGARISADRVILRGPASMAAIDAAIDATRLALAAEMAGLASRALEITQAYTSDRVQFGKPIAAFQAVQHRLVDMWADAEFACSAVVNACERVAEADKTAAKLAILAAKARAGDAAVTVGRRAIHLHGAMGFTDECDIGHYMKRAVALNSALGQPEALRLQFLALERAA